MPLIPRNKFNSHYGDNYDEEGVDWPDEEVADFIRQLDSRTELNLSDWEAGFVESNLTSRRFSSKQRVVVKRLHQKYGD